MYVLVNLHHSCSEQVFALTSGMTIKWLNYNDISTWVGRTEWQTLYNVIVKENENDFKDIMHHLYKTDRYNILIVRKLSCDMLEELTFLKLK
jgi:hypothetical protein